jgi:hypothetical protein
VGRFNTRSRSSKGVVPAISRPARPAPFRPRFHRDKPGWLAVSPLNFSEPMDTAARSAPHSLMVNTAPIALIPFHGFGAGLSPATALAPKSYEIAAAANVARPCLTPASPWRPRAIRSHTEGVPRLYVQWSITMYYSRFELFPLTVLPGRATPCLGTHNPLVACSSPARPTKHGTGLALIRAPTSIAKRPKMAAG